MRKIGACSVVSTTVVGPAAYLPRPQRHSRLRGQKAVELLYIELKGASKENVLMDGKNDQRSSGEQLERPWASMFNRRAEANRNEENFPALQFQESNEKKPFILIAAYIRSDTFTRW